MVCVGDRSDGRPESSIFEQILTSMQACSPGRSISVAVTWFAHTVVAGFLIIVPVGSALAQNVVVAGAVSGNGSYATLGTAFAAVNANDQTAATITISIVGSTTESTPAVLSAGTWNALTIAPSGGAPRVISGSIDAAPIIDLSGADQVTVDGLNTGGNALAVQNTSVSDLAGTSTIRFQNDASNNTIVRCRILGATNALAATGANILFSTGIATGNDGNTVSACDIGPVGGLSPNTCIASLGTTSSTARNNSGNVVTGCNIFDFQHHWTSNFGIYLANGSTDWTISNNRFYQTSPVWTDQWSLHVPIYLNTTGNNFQIIDNLIGHANSAGTGYYTVQRTSPGNSELAVKGIEVANVGTTTATVISGNTIAGYSIRGKFHYVYDDGAFVGILVRAGLVHCNNNTIGSLSAPNSINVVMDGTEFSDVIGIMSMTSQPFVSNNNSIGGITICSSSTGHLRFAGMISSGGGWTATGNTIGGTMEGSIQNTTPTVMNMLVGIRMNSGTGTLTGNEVRNMSAAGYGGGVGPNSSPLGILVLNGSCTITGNRIHALRNGEPTPLLYGRFVAGIYVQGTGFTFERNTIYDLTAVGIGSTIHGIILGAGTGTIKNNMITLGSTVQSGASITGVSILSSAAHTAAFNSIHINGTATEGAADSYALGSTQSSTTRTYRNNILSNTRSSAGSTGHHYGISINGSGPNSPGLTCDQNLFHVTGTNGVLGRFDLLGDFQTLAQWQAGTNEDLFSSTGDPRFIAPSAASPDLHIQSGVPTPVEGRGAALGSVPIDLDLETRAGLTPTDIGADAGNFTPLAQCSGVPPSGTISGPATVCMGGSGSLQFTNGSIDLGLSYQWRSASAPGGPWGAVIGTDIVQSTGAVTNDKWFQVTTTCANGGATTVSAPYLVSAIPLPVATATNSGPACANTNLQLNGTSTTGTLHVWTGPNGYTSSQLSPAIPALPLNGSGTYTLTSTSPEGCVSAPATTVVSVIPGAVLSNVSASPNPTCPNGNAQLTSLAHTATLVKQMTFTAGTGTLAPMTGATIALAAPNDNTPSAAPLAIGFAFPFNGSTFTQFSVSPDGWLLLGGATAVAQPIPVVNSNTNTPKISAFWNDHTLGTNGSVKYLVTGTAPDRVLKVQWHVALPYIFSNQPANSTFQAWLYERNGQVELRYGAMFTPDAEEMVAGLTGSSTNYQNITFVGGTSSTTVPVSSNISVPVNGTLYTFSASAITSYAWSPSTFLTSTVVRDPLAMGINVPAQEYSITATNTFGCSVSQSITVNTSSISAAAIAGASYFCPGGSTVLSIDEIGGVQPYTYVWGPSGLTSPSISVDTIGTFSCTVTDACGTQVVASAFTVQEQALGSPCDDGDPSTVGDVLVAPCICQGTNVSVNVRVLLEGPFDQRLWLMNDALRELPTFPLNEPYTGLGLPTMGAAAAPTTTAVLSIEGPDAIVDWVMVEARTGTNGTTIEARRPALLQRDGDVVAMDGFSPVLLPVAPGDYRVAVRHRNHLGVMSAAALSLSTAPVMIDFTTPATAVFGSDARKDLGGPMGLWTGDVTRNGEIKYTGTGNDRDPVLVAVGGTLPTNTINGYHGADVNLDGIVKYTGTNNDRDPILVNIGGTVPTAVRTQQLP